MSYLQAIVVAVVQGVTELFPVSSLGHSVIVPAWLGGSWETLVTQSSQSTSETSFYLAYIVDGLILLLGERLRRRAVERSGAPQEAPPTHHDRVQEAALALQSDHTLARIPVADSLRVGILQVAALFPGISRSGITMVGGLW